MQGTKNRRIWIGIYHALRTGILYQEVEVFQIVAVHYFCIVEKQCVVEAYTIRGHDYVAVQHIKSCIIALSFCAYAEEQIE